MLTSFQTTLHLQLRVAGCHLQYIFIHFKYWHNIQKSINLNTNLFNKFNKTKLKPSRISKNIEV